MSGTRPGSGPNGVDAVFYKQVVDSLRNKSALMMFLMFPLVALIFKNAMTETPLASALPMFMTMHVLIVPIIYTSSVVAEEKEAGTLRMLTMSGVGPLSYLCGVAGTIGVASILSSLLFLPCIDGLNAGMVERFLMTNAACVACSLLIGLAIALVAKRQVNAAPISAPVSMALGMLPMLSSLNDRLEAFARWTYTQPAYEQFSDLASTTMTSREAMVVAVNAMALVVLFLVLFRMRRLTD